MPLPKLVLPGDEVTNKMIEGIKDDPAPITTHQLSKGSIHRSNPPSRASSTPLGSASGGGWFPPPSTQVDPTIPHHRGSPLGRPLPSNVQTFQSIGVVELLEQDDRPTFVVDLSQISLSDNANGPGQLDIIFANSSLRTSKETLGLLSPDVSDPQIESDFERFKEWVIYPVYSKDSYIGAGGDEGGTWLSSTSYAGVNWTRSTLRRKYRIVKGTSVAKAPTPTFSPTFSHVATPLSSVGQERRSITPEQSLEPPLEQIGATGDDVDVASVASPGARLSLQHSPLGLGDQDILMTEDDYDIAALSADMQPPLTGLPPAVLPAPEEPASPAVSTSEVKPSFDWTRIEVNPAMSAHIRFARSIDWASTPIGPIENWPADLRIMSNMIMGTPHPAAMYWGPEYTMIYNEAYIGIAGKKHPNMMGRSYKDVWAEIWHDIEPVFANAWHHGQALMKHDDHLFVVRHGFLEETFFNWSVIPMVGGDGNVVALYNPAFEMTRRKVNERRMLTLREIGEKTSQARDIKGFWSLVLKGLEFNEYDVPFVMIYSTPEDPDSEVSSLHSGSLANLPSLQLEGSHGVPVGHPIAVPFVDLRVSDEGFAPYMRECMSRGGRPVVLSKEQGTIPSDLLEGLEWRGFGDPSRFIVIFPVYLTTTDSVVGFIVMGTNPRRPYNEDYELFVQLLSRQLATSMASVVLFEDEIRRGQRAAQRAAQDRQELSLQLRLRTQEAVESEYKFSRMAEFAPVGIFITNGRGSLTYCNDMWWEISRHPRSATSSSGASVGAGPTYSVSASQTSIPSDDEVGMATEAWMQSVLPEDRPGLEAVWTRMVKDKQAITAHTFRFKAPSMIEGHPVDTWVLMSAFPEKDEHGGIKRVFGCMTDISQQKWAETFQRQRRLEAVELKRQQESFIDMTSHEMRNPLSAILQCADEISNGLSRFKAEGKLGELTLALSSHYNSPSEASSALQEIDALIDDAIEASNTIALCASHQKRIVDDILTFSKLDSQLLLVTPVDAQPMATVRKVARMFESEFKSNDIQLDFRVEQSYFDLAVDWVKVDPSRLRQVLINLITNAIKFTTNCDTRNITVSLGAARDYGDGQPPIGQLKYIPTRGNERKRAGSAGSNGDAAGGVDSLLSATSSPSATTTSHKRKSSAAAKVKSITDGPDWGQGEKIYLIFGVTDTGPGLDDGEMKVLFQRFSQATPRTHVQYGGSGLGLYICRTLSELQGGQISVTSEKGVGSTFAFYIKARKVDPENLSPSTVGPAEGAPFGPPAPISTILAGQHAAAASPGSATSSASPTVAGMAMTMPSPSQAADPAAPKATSSSSSSLRRRSTIGSNTGAAVWAAAVTSRRPSGASSTADQKPLPLDVLIVEDNVVNQRVLQRQLNRCGNNTMVANHGGEALEVLQRSRYWRHPSPSPLAVVSGNKSTPELLEGGGTAPHQVSQESITTMSSISVTSSSASKKARMEALPTNINISVILMDLEMPVMDGMTCARRIRQLEKEGVIAHHIPIIAVTAYARPEQIETAKAAGIDDVISKPFRIPELIPKIEELSAAYNTRAVEMQRPQPQPLASPAS